MADDRQFFIEGFTKIRYESGSIDHWRFNRPQIKFFNDHYSRITTCDDPFRCVVVRTDRKTINLKSRQHGFTTGILADIVHDFCFVPGCHVKVVSYKAKTAEKMKWIVDELYQGAIDTIAGMGRNPHRFLPYADTDHATMLKCDATGSTIEFLTFEGKGTAQGETVNRIYGTEISLWTHWSDHWPGLIGTAVKDGSFVSDLDFNARGAGNPSHKRYINAKKGESDYKANFTGTNDYDYPRGFLDEQRRELGPRAFKEQYPANDIEAFQKNDRSIFDPEMIERNRHEKYYYEQHPDVDPASRFHVIGVDPAEGLPDGDNTAIKIFDAETMIEAAKPDIGKWNPRETGHRVKNTLTKYPGVFNVLRLNHGHAVHEVLTDLGIMRFSFVDDDGKPGYPENSRARITIMETELDCALDADEIGLVDEIGIDELKIYQKNDNGKTGAPETTDDDDGGRYFDDAARATMAVVVARDFARRRARAMRNATATIADDGLSDIV